MTNANLRDELDALNTYYFESEEHYRVPAYDAPGVSCEVWEDASSWFISTGADVPAEYSKADWSLAEALKNEFNV